MRMADQNPTPEELERVARRLRRQDREETLLSLVEVALLYHAELQRDDPRPLLSCAGGNSGSARQFAGR